MSGLSCVNCGKETPSDKAKFFAQVFCCEDCYTIAMRLLERGDKELKMLLLLLKESIRVSMVNRTLSFSPEQLGDMPREDLLEALQKMASKARMEATQEKPWPDTSTPTPILSKATTSPSAASLGAASPRSSGST